jgi:hypothetical protein
MNSDNGTGTLTQIDQARLIDLSGISSKGPHMLAPALLTHTPAGTTSACPPSASQSRGLFEQRAAGGQDHVHTAPGRGPGCFQPYTA